MPPFAYLFERFPSFTQTFCAREVMELQRRGWRPALYSIRSVTDEAVKHFPPELVAGTIVLPPPDELKAEVHALKEQGALPPHFVLTLRHWGERPDKMRLYEAAWTGHRLRAAGVRHVHTHFAGIAARTCWWIRQFFGFSYSFTGHANDLFCPDESAAVPLETLVCDAAAVITVSDWSRAWLTARCPESGRFIHRVYNGLDLAPLIRTAEAAQKAHPPLIVSAGRLIEKKGFDDLIRACALLHANGIAFRCVIAGEGPLREPLAAQIAEAGMSEIVHLPGAMSQPEIAALLGRASVFALACATGSDGGMDVLPTVIVEAMAAGLPVASTRVGGVPEMVIDGRTGVLTNERNPAAFAGALERLLSDDTEARAMGTAGLALARERFSLELTVPQLQRILGRRARLKLPVWRHPLLRLQSLARCWHPRLGAPRHPRDRAVSS